MLLLLIQSLWVLLKRDFQIWQGSETLPVLLHKCYSSVGKQKPVNRNGIAQGGPSLPLPKGTKGMLVHCKHGLWLGKPESSRACSFPVRLWSDTSSELGSRREGRTVGSLRRLSVFLEHWGTISKQSNG